MSRLPLFALVLFLSTGWWGDVVRATAAALGLHSVTAADVPTPPPSPPNPTTDGGSEWDPWG